MSDYANGKIYRIVCNETGEQYIGSTTQPLNRRLSKHIHHSKNNKYTQCKSADIIQRGDFAIELIEDYPCETKEELFARERHFIESMQCVNVKMPTRTLEEIREYYKQYRERDEKREHMKQYRETHREEIREQLKQYRETHREEIRERMKQYYAKKKAEREANLIIKNDLVPVMEYSLTPEI
jgi:hypothetical protein